MDYIRDRKSNISFSLHDSRILQIEINEDKLSLNMDRIFQYTDNEEKWYKGIIEFTNIDKEECNIMVFNAPYGYNEVKSFSGKELSLQSLLDEGCLMSITKDVIDYMSLEVPKKDSDSKQRMYLMWDNLLERVDNFPDKQKVVFIQAMSEVFASFVDEARNIDRGILHILTTNILLLRKQKIEMSIDETGKLSFSIVNIEPEEQRVEVKEK